MRVYNCERDHKMRLMQLFPLNLHSHGMRATLPVLMKSSSRLLEKTRERERERERREREMMRERGETRERGERERDERENRGERRKRERNKEKKTRAGRFLRHNPRCCTTLANGQTSTDPDL